MDLKRLFHVLVVGGSVAAGCERSRMGGLTAADAAEEQDVGMPDSAAPDAPGAAEDAAASDVISMDVAAMDLVSMDATAMDATATADAAIATDAIDGPAGSPCFCSPTKCCDLHEGAPATVQAGVFCCWGTKC
jgi:hypothetical protein